MRRAQVTEVSGRHVCAGGKWVTCIGNHTPSIGELVWTDGRCVYGNEQEGGGSSVVQSTRQKGGIPVLSGRECCLYQQGQLKDLGRLAHGWASSMTNDRRHVELSQDYLLLDADFDAEGTRIALEGADLEYNRWSEHFYAPRGSCVRKGDEVFRTYDVTPYADEMYREIVYHDPNDTGSIPWLLYGIVTFHGRTVGGTVDADGNFKVMVRLLYDAATYPSVIVPPLELLVHGFGVDYFLFDGTNAEPWCRKRFFQWRTYTTTHEGPIDHTENEVWCAENGSLRYLLPDGWYATFDGIGDFDSFIGEKCKDCVSHIFDPDGTLALSVPFAPHDVKAVKRIGEGRYLLVIRYKLYRWEDGTLRHMADSCYNFRLREMTNLKAWKGLI